MTEVENEEYEENEEIVEEYEDKSDESKEKSEGKKSKRKSEEKSKNDNFIQIKKKKNENQQEQQKSIEFKFCDICKQKLYSNKDYYCPTKEGLNGESFHKLHLLTQNKTIINNNIKKIIPKKSNSEKIKNLKVEKKINIVSKNITNNKNKSQPYLLIKNQIYNCKKLIKKPLMKNNEKERYST